MIDIVSICKNLYIVFIKIAQKVKILRFCDIKMVGNIGQLMLVLIMGVKNMINIFERIDDKFDLKEKIKNLSMLFLEHGFFYDSNYYSISFDTFCNDNFFRQWNYSYGCYSLREFQKKAGVDYFETHIGEKFFSASNEIDAIKYLQYSYNIVSFVKESIQNTETLTQTEQKFFKIFSVQFNYILSKLGQQVIRHAHEDYFIIVPSNDKTTRCANMQNKEETAFLLYEYTSSLLIGNIKRKQEILKLLANDVEPIISANLLKYNSGPVHDIFDNLRSCLNNFNIRHNNSDPTKIGNYHARLDSFSEQDYEEIYDATYDLILDAYLLNEYAAKTKVTYLKLKAKAGF